MLNPRRKGISILVLWNCGLKKYQLNTSAGVTEAVIEVINGLKVQKYDYGMHMHLIEVMLPTCLIGTVV